MYYVDTLWPCQPKTNTFISNTAVRCLSRHSTKSPLCLTGRFWWLPYFLHNKITLLSRQGSPHQSSFWREAIVCCGQTNARIQTLPTSHNNLQSRQMFKTHVLPKIFYFLLLPLAVNTMERKLKTLTVLEKINLIKSFEKSSLSKIVRLTRTFGI